MPKYGPISLQWVENYTTYVVFCSFSAKKWSQINFFFLNFPRYRAFFAYFLQKKNTCFFSKIPYYSDYQFWKCSFQKSIFFSTVFRRLRKSFGWYYTGVLAQKIERYMEWYPFFFCDILFFFCWKKFHGLKSAKKKRISLLKSRISLFNLTSVPYFGIKRGYHFIYLSIMLAKTLL